VADGRWHMKRTPLSWRKRGFAEEKRERPSIEKWMASTFVLKIQASTLSSMN